MNVNWKLSHPVVAIPQRLRQALTRGEMSKLARAIGSSPSRISDIAAGRTHSVTLDMALEMERSLGVDLLGPDREAIAQQLESKAAMVRGNLAQLRQTPRDRVD